MGRKLVKDRFSLAVAVGALVCVSVLATGPMWATAATDTGGLPPGVGANFAAQTLLGKPNTVIGSVTITTSQDGTLMASATAYISHVKSPAYSGAICRLILDKYYIAVNEGEASEGGAPIANVAPVASLVTSTSWSGVSAGKHTVELECRPLIPISGYEVMLEDPHLNVWAVG